MTPSDPTATPPLTGDASPEGNVSLPAREGTEQPDPTRFNNAAGMDEPLYDRRRPPAACLIVSHRTASL
ncbi:MAG: hypothetical protein Kow0059_02390 [Candidatus Sumerlaeia bacterium]